MKNQSYKIDAQVIILVHEGAVPCWAFDILVYRGFENNEHIKKLAEDLYQIDCEHVVKFYESNTRGIKKEDWVYIGGEDTSHYIDDECMDDIRSMETQRLDYFLKPILKQIEDAGLKYIKIRED